MILRLVLWFIITLLTAGCMTTTQFKDIPSGKDGAGNPMVIRTYAREGIRFGFGTDYVIPVQQRCSIDGDGAVSVCEILDANIIGSETFFENLTTGAAIGAFFPLIRPSGGSTSSSSGGSASAEASATSESRANATAKADAKVIQQQQRPPNPHHPKRGHGDRD